MKDFKLNNLRQLTTEEQLNLNGGAFSDNCNVDCGTCNCPCRCDNKNPEKSVGNDFSKTGSNSQTQRKQAQALQRM